MPTYRVVIEYTSKRTVELDADSPDAAALAAMRRLEADDAEAGPVGYVVLDGDTVVADRRAWRPRRSRATGSSGTGPADEPDGRSPRRRR